MKNRTFFYAIFIVYVLCRHMNYYFELHKFVNNIDVDVLSYLTVEN